MIRLPRPIADFAAYCRDFRTKYDLTQEELAKLLLLDRDPEKERQGRRTVQDWEAGRRTPPPYIALVFAYLEIKLRRKRKH